MASPTSAGAAEVKPGGYPRHRRSPASRASRRSAASRTIAQLDPDLSRGLDFRNDTEVHVLARGKSEQTGLEYGATIEFEADTNQTFNTDETWIFLRGGWGELRLGDEDGVVDNSVVGGQTIAAGTGGIDGSDCGRSPAAPTACSRPTPTTRPRSATTRRASAASASASATRRPRRTFDSGANNGQFFASKDGAFAMEAENIVEGALVYDGDLGGVGVLASVVGLYGELKNDAEDTVRRRQVVGRPDGGANVDLFGFKLGGSVGHDEVGDDAARLLHRRHRRDAWAR